MMITIEQTPFKRGIQLLIMAHLTLFILAMSAASKNITDFILSSDIGSLSSHWWSVMTYQFVHTEIHEFMLSMGALWFFGRILQKRAGCMAVLRLYAVSAVTGSAVFLLAHQIFPTFAGRNHMMEGAFISVLSIMTATLATCGSRYTLQFGGVSVLLWHVYLAVLATSLFLVYEHNIACILTYLAGIAVGFRYSYPREGDFRSSALKLPDHSQQQRQASVSL